MNHMQLGLAAVLLGLAMPAAGSLAAPLGAANLPAQSSEREGLLLVRDGDEEAGLNREVFGNERWRFSDDYYPRYYRDRVYGYSSGPTVAFGLGTYAYPYRHRYYGYPYRYRYDPSFGLYINP